MSEWTKIGDVAVDAGLVMICDPCVVLHRGQKVTIGDQEFDPAPPHPEFGTTWPTFCDSLSSRGITQVGRALAVVSLTQFGDGVYPVFARRDAEGRVAALKVVFDGEGS